MNKKKLRIDIPQPCHEKWEEMAPREQGRHCQKCEKTVIDFTNKTDQQIVALYKQNKGKLCGHFKTTQLNSDFHLKFPFVGNTRLKAAGLLLTTFLAVSSCDSQHKTKGMVTPPIELPADHLTGVVSIPLAPDWIQKVYPNPFNEQITAEIKSYKAEGLRIVITDVSGRAIFEQKISVQIGSNQYNFTLDETNYVPGSYFFSIYRKMDLLQTKLIEKNIYL